LVIVEAFSKWIDLVSLTAKVVSLAFRERLLARFKRPVEVTSDNGAEYKAEFQQLCIDLGIEHRLITAGQPERV
jgi:transposase InsO family protein